VQDAVHVADKSSPELKDAMRRGDVGVNTAANRLRGLVPHMAPTSSAASGTVRPGNPLLALAAGCDDRRMTTRRFPPPWRAEKMPGGYVVRDANDQALAYVYSRANEAEAMQAKVLTDDEARRVAVNIAKLPALLRHGE
jgi:hypothetical protein